MTLKLTPAVAHCVTFLLKEGLYGHTEVEVVQRLLCERLGQLVHERQIERARIKPRPRAKFFPKRA